MRKNCNHRSNHKLLVSVFFHLLFLRQIIAAARDVQEKKEIYAPYNILPLDSAGAAKSVVQLEEVQILTGLSSIM